MNEIPSLMPARKHFIGVRSKTTTERARCTMQSHASLTPKFKDASIRPMVFLGKYCIRCQRTRLDIERTKSFFGFF